MESFANIISVRPWTCMGGHKSSSILLESPGATPACFGQPRAWITVVADDSTVSGQPGATYRGLQDSLNDLAGPESVEQNALWGHSSCCCCVGPAQLDTAVSCTYTTRTLR